MDQVPVIACRATGHTQFVAWLHMQSCTDLAYFDCVPVLPPHDKQLEQISTGQHVIWLHSYIACMLCYQYIIC